MSDKKNKNVSETFGKYAQNSSKSSRNVREPKNITSDMWIPISTGQAEEVSQKSVSSQSAKSRQQEATKRASESKKRPEGEQNFISEGRKKQGKAPAGKSKKRSRIPKGRPVSETASDSASVRKQQSDRIRNQQKLSKAERDYDDRIKEGKSPSELSKERAQNKRKRRKRRNILSVALFLVFVLAFVGVYTYSKGAPVSVITVEGECIYSDEEILSAAQLELGVNMFSLREKNINELVTASLPYIHSVEIDRKLPDSLVLTVTASEDKYLIMNDGVCVCLDEYGKVLSLEKKSLDDGLYRVYGLKNENSQPGIAFTVNESDGEKYELMKRLVAAMEQEGVITRATVNVSDLKNVTVYYKNQSNNIMIYLGDCSELESRMALAGRVISSPEVSGKTGYIDMRFGDAAYFNEGTIYLG